jgi:putative photosynthetic complex assembly protein 2
LAVAEHGLPVLFTLFLWWFSTGAILYLDGLPAASFRWTMLAATALAGVAAYGLWATSADTTLAGAYIAFTCGLLVWGWHETSFLTGFVTGPRKAACPQGCGGWRHFVHASETIIHHELAIAGTALLVVALTWGGENQVGTWTFVILWVMRLSAKLNVFLGVPNLTEEFLPEHLHYLRGFLTKKPMNLLFPVSVVLSTVATVLLVQAAIAPEATAFEATAFTFLASLMALAILEHWFLVLPLPDAALWSWALRSRAGAPDGTSPLMPTVPVATAAVVAAPLVDLARTTRARRRPAGSPHLPLAFGSSSYRRRP